MNPQKSALPRDIERIAIVGVGLIGGSIAAAIRKRGFAVRVTGCGRSLERLERARREGLIDQVAGDPAEAARGCDLVVVCTPVDTIVPSVRAAAAEANRGALLTDAGSVKRSICGELAEGLPAGISFIGSHPMAGSERQGFEHADPDLFEGRITVVTPQPGEEPGNIERLKAFWSSLGSKVVELSPEVHDRYVAEVSHVPHVAAAALMGLLSDANRELAASGFRDTTRVAAGDPEIWRPILLSNADEVGRGLDALIAGLARFREAIGARDADRLEELLKEAKQKRDALG